MKTAPSKKGDRATRPARPVQPARPELSFDNLSSPEALPVELLLFLHARYLEAKQLGTEAYRFTNDLYDHASKNDDYGRLEVFTGILDNHVTDLEEKLIRMVLAIHGRIKFSTKLDELPAGWKPCDVTIHGIRFSVVPDTTEVYDGDQNPTPRLVVLNSADALFVEDTTIREDMGLSELAEKWAKHLASLASDRGDD